MSKLFDTPATEVEVKPTTTPPPAEDKPAVDVKEEQAKLDWASDLPDDLKTNSSILKFKTKEDLVKSYIHLESKLGKGPVKISSETDYKEVGNVLKESMGLNDDTYKELDPAIKTLASEAGVHKDVAKGLDRIVKQLREDIPKKVHKTKLAKWEEEHRNSPDLQEKENNIFAGIKSLGTTAEDLKKELGDDFFNPKFLSVLEKRGREYRKEDSVQIREGKNTAGLPSDRDQLEALYREKNRELAELGNRPERDVTKMNEIKKEMQTIVHKIEGQQDRRKPRKRIY